MSGTVTARLPAKVMHSLLSVFAIDSITVCDAKAVLRLLPPYHAIPAGGAWALRSITELVRRTRELAA